MNNDMYCHKIYKKWNKFVEGDLAATQGMRKEVENSWIRCLNARVNPYQKSPFVNSKKIRELLIKHKLLLTMTAPYIDLVHQLIQETGFVIVVTNEQGYLLDIKGDDQVMADSVEDNFVIGANWSESEVGTNAISLAIIEDKPIQIVGPEHYNKLHHAWTCSAAPIHDPNGNIIGTIDLSGHKSLIHKHTLGMVIALVKAIEKEFHVKEKSESLKFVNEHLRAILDSMSDGVIAIDNKKKIIAINNNLKKMMNIRNLHPDNINISELFKEKPLILETLRTGQKYIEREDVIITKSHRKICLNTSLPIYSDNEVILGAVSIIKEKKELHRLINRMLGARASFKLDDIVTQSKKMNKTVMLARAVAETDTRVLIEGESGTGKEIFAQGIHNASKRYNGPFIAVNCSAIPRELIESELFGYEHGAFTGAAKGGKPGKFELADGGTLFLDEISSMPLEMQAKLLRVLQQNEFTRVGGIETIPVNVRIIAASNQPLETLIEEKLFRSDLFYRIGVVILKIPALRERLEDIPLLLNHLMDKVCKKINIPAYELDEEVFSTLCRYSWPGNVREMENYIERAIILAAGNKHSKQLNIDHFPRIVTQNHLEKQENNDLKSLARIEKDAIKKALAFHEGNISKSARTLGIARNTLYNKLKYYNINASQSNNYN